MLPYASIASCLEEASSARRSSRPGVVAGLLSSAPPEIISTSVRLLMGELWPPWEGREMGMGPEMISQALEELSSRGVAQLRSEISEMGSVAEAAIEARSQHALLSEPLDVLHVYRCLRRISDERGASSEHRKGSILRGLFLSATPKEARYIARTLTGRMISGIGPKTMISALAEAFDMDEGAICDAYSIMPDIGRLAESCLRGDLAHIRIRPGVPLKPMIFPPGDGTLPRACQPRHEGLRVQVHSGAEKPSVYTMRLKDITPSLQALAGRLAEIGHQFIAEADLVCFHDGSLMSRAEVVRYINRDQNSRRAGAAPALMLNDLLFLDGQDLTPIPYAKRRSRLRSVLVSDGTLPETGIYLSEEIVLESRGEALPEGIARLISRDPDGCYSPGKVSATDFLVTGGLI